MTEGTAVGASLVRPLVVENQEPLWLSPRRKPANQRAVVAGRQPGRFPLQLAASVLTARLQKCHTWCVKPAVGMAADRP